MRKFISILNTTLMLVLVSVLFSGCLKDTCKHIYTYTIYEPVYKTATQVMDNIKSNAPIEIGDPGKLVILGKYIFLNEVDKGIHVIDNSNPSSPKNVAFIDLPGNLDLAIKGNTIYADLYTELIVLDITDPLHVIKIKTVDGVFPQRNYGLGFTPNGSGIITGWVHHDTTITEDCMHQGLIVPGGIATPGVLANSFSSQSSSPSPLIGITGSMARFALVGDYLYTVDDNDLNIFNIAQSSDPELLNKLNVDFHVETIYPFKNDLFIGSNNGMFIFDVAGSPASPAELGTFTHARSCDPVIADDSFAYVTLHSETTCLGFNNELDVVRLNNLSNSELVKTYNLTSPHGLAKDDNLLFVCDGTDGLKVYNASDVLNLQLIKQFPNLETYDVIAYNKVAIVVAKDGLYQFDYTAPNNIHLLSKISISN